MGLEEEEKEKERVVPEVPSADLPELEPVPPSTSPPSSSTSQLRSSSLPETPPRISRDPDGHPSRRRAQQTYGWNYHCRRWCPPQHPRCSPPLPQGQEPLNGLRQQRLVNYADLKIGLIH